MKIYIPYESIQSNQDLAETPDMIAITIGGAFIQTAQKAIEFMKQNGISFMVSWYQLGYKLYEETAEEGIFDLELGGALYKQYEPEFAIDGCHAKVYADGTLSAALPFKHSEEKFFFTLGEIGDLTKQMEACIKVSDLANDQLDWAVGIALGYEMRVNYNAPQRLYPAEKHRKAMWASFMPTCEANVANPIIEKHQIAVWPDQDNPGMWFASTNEGAGTDYSGNTLLVAAMRCFVAAKLGEEIAVPADLK